MATSIDPSLLISSSQNAQRKTGSSSLGKDDFLKILMTQLQNQDPLNPMQDKDFVAQLATFSSLEQMTNMNTTLQSLVDAQNQNNLTAYTQFVGKDVNWTKQDTSTDTSSSPTVTQGTGRVTSIQFKNNNVYFTLSDGTVLEPGNISQVDGTSNENSLLQASMLIGKKVTYLNSSQEEMSANVTSASFKNGSILLQLDDGNNTTIGTSQITGIE
ncbi:MAG: flagellar hook assembly protein FlgD [Bacillota bacterium]|nr:flagellar hook assembly protein FlgD [Bacillota bacterium]